MRVAKSISRREAGTFTSHIERSTITRPVKCISATLAHSLVATYKSKAFYIQSVLLCTRTLHVFKIILQTMWVQRALTVTKISKYKFKKEGKRKEQRIEDQLETCNPPSQEQERCLLRSETERAPAMHTAWEAKFKYNSPLDCQASLLQRCRRGE